MKNADVKSKEQALDMLKEYRVNATPVFNNLDQPVEGYSLISYEDNFEPICIVSKNYGILQHDDILNRTFQDLERTGVNFEVQNITINDSIKRNSMIATITLPDLKINVDDSEIKGSVFISNGTDGFTSFERTFGFFRTACTNSLMIAQGFISEKKKHRRNISIIDLEEKIEELRMFMPQFGEILEKAQAVKLVQLNMENMRRALQLAPRVFNNILSGEYQNKYKEMIQETVDLNTLWGFYQVMTNYLTHEVAPRTIQTSRVLNERLFNYIRAQVA